MQPSSPAHFDKGTSFSNGDQLDFHKSQLELLRSDALEAYSGYEKNDVQSGRDTYQIGAAAIMSNEPSPGELAVSGQEIVRELTLFQMGQNIERMRQDITGKSINSAFESAQGGLRQSDVDLAA